jgi:adenylate cyclase class 2
MSAPGQHLLVELKARCAGLDPIRAALANRAAHEVTVRQVDTYFDIPRARLKLREVRGRPAQLIHHERPDLAAVKSSRVHVASTPDGLALRALLAAALGVRVRVVKIREIWRWEGVQVHLDTVPGLGTFVEFEAVVDAPARVPAARARLSRLLTSLGLGSADLVDRSYGDLVEGPVRRSGGGRACPAGHRRRG